MSSLREFVRGAGIPADDADVARLVEVFGAQVEKRGRAHHAAILSAMRKHLDVPLTERTQELALMLRRRLRCCAPKVKKKDVARPPSAGKDAQPGAAVPHEEDKEERAEPASAAIPYYPGCLAEETSREYDASIRLLARILDIPLETIDGWNCCGAGVVDDADARSLAEHMLVRARLDEPAVAHKEAAPQGERTTSLKKPPIVSGCPTCVRSLQSAGGADCARHILGVFAAPEVREKIAAKIKETGAPRPLGSMKVACFYGQSLSDPALWGGTPEGESWPMDQLMELAGAEVVKWGGARRAAAGYLLYAKPDAGLDMLAKVFRDFEKSGADAIVTADPHAHFNLDTFQYEIGRRRKAALEVPVLHFTEVLALAMELDALDAWLDRHMAGAIPMLDRLMAAEAKRGNAEEHA